MIGHPVRHSLSPALHNAAFRAVGLDWLYLAFDVPPGGAGGAVAAVRALGLAGLNVTMPHKAAAAAAVDRLSPVASALGAVNTVVPDGAALVGESTDGAGLVAALAADHGFEAGGRRCVVLGGGGAGRAAVLALAGERAADVVVVARRREQLDAAVSLAGPVGRPGRPADVEDADLVVNATPVTGELPFGVDPASFRPGQLVVDLSYRPRVTALMGAAAAAGARAANGVGMLVHQAALAFRLWTGSDAPLGDMQAAVAAHRTTDGP